MRGAIGVVLLLPSLALTACGAAAPPAGAASEGAVAGTASAASGPRAWQRPADLDIAAALSKLPPARHNAAVEPLLRKWADSCQTVKLGDQMYSCDSAATRALDDWARDTKAPDLYETLAEIAIAHDDPKMRLAAVNQMDSLRGTVGHPFVHDHATPPAALRVLKLLHESKGTPAFVARLASTAVSLGPPAGLADLTYAIVDDHPVDTARTASYGDVMKYGHDAGFRYLVHAVKKRPELARIAMHAPRQMYDKTKVDKAEVCAWSESYFLRDKEPVVVSEAGRTLLWFCGPQTIPTLLKEGERRLAAKDLPTEVARLYREPCFSPIAGLGVDEAKRQCNEVYAFLEKVGNTEGLPSEVRGEALWNIYYQRRNEETLALLRKYEQHPDEVIRKKVQDAIRSLES